MDNCGGQDADELPPNVTVAFLPPRSTAKYQSLDLGLIGHSKIRYRSLLLRASIEIILKRRRGNHQFKSNSGQGKWGLQDGQLPHVGDAIMLFDESWRQTKRSTVLKCWMKSQCLSRDLVAVLQHELNCLLGVHEDTIDMTSGAGTSFNNENAVEHVVDQATAARIHADLQSHRYLERPETPLNEVLAEVEDICTANELLLAMNTPAPFDHEATRNEIADREIQSLFDKHRQSQQGETRSSTEEIQSDSNTTNQEAEREDLSADPTSVDAACDALDGCIQLMRCVTSNPTVLEPLERARVEVSQLITN